MRTKNVPIIVIIVIVIAIYKEFGKPLGLNAVG